MADERTSLAPLLNLTHVVGVFDVGIYTNNGNDGLSIFSWYNNIIIARMYLRYVFAASDSHLN
jgi:hypothetical protein